MQSVFSYDFSFIEFVILLTNDVPNIVYFDTARFFFIEYMYRTEYTTDLVTLKCSSVVVYVYPL